MFWKFQKPLVGVDITPNAVKLLAFEPEGKTHRVQHYAMAPLESGVVVDRKIKQPEKISEAIMLAMQQAKCSFSHAAIALPAANVISKVIPVSSALSEMELEE